MGVHTDITTTTMRSKKIESEKKREREIKRSNAVSLTSCSYAVIHFNLFDSILIWTKKMKRTVHYGDSVEN